MTKEELLIENKQLKEENKIIQTLLLEIKKLTEELAKLKAQLNMNSSNSSMPPSTDKLKKNKKTKSLRVPSGKSSGGQSGHKGVTLLKSEKPNYSKVIPHEMCPHCNTDIKNTKIDKLDKHQVFDIPLPVIEITEYVIQEKICPHCKKKSTSQFPAQAKQPVQYGKNVQAMITALNVVHSMPYNQIQEYLANFFNLHLSQGTIANILRRGFNALENVEAQIKEKLQEAKVLHADETGNRVNGKTHWFHVYSNLMYTYLFSHKSRGKKAIDESKILENFHGILSHDCFSSYDRFTGFEHSLCCAHFFRELNSIKENADFKFPDLVKEILMEMKEKSKLEYNLSKKEEDFLVLKYVRIIEEAKKEEELANPFDPTKGRRRSKSYNLLKRLSRIVDVLNFFFTKNEEIFTNNQAERDIRILKVKGKVSGGFRSEKGASWYARIRGYASTIKKQGLNLLEAIVSIFSYGEILNPTE